MKLFLKLITARSATTLLTVRVETSLVEKLALSESSLGKPMPETAVPFRTYVNAAIGSVATGAVSKNANPSLQVTIVNSASELSASSPGSLFGSQAESAAAKLSVERIERVCMWFMVTLDFNRRANAGARAITAAGV